MSDAEPVRVLAIASGGGHWVQLRRLREAFEGSETHWATVDSRYGAELADAPLHVVTDANQWQPWKLLMLALQAFALVLRLRPEVVVTTGAAPGFFAVVFGKLLGARTVWIDSIANADELSGSGSRVGRFADLWLTQWPHLTREEGPHFEGAVL